jgi:hypothetical protein
MIHQRLSLLFALLSTSMHAQWLNFRTPGTPRTPDGKPKLDARVPRDSDGKPDLSGVWMHETSSVAEMKRIFSNRFDATVKVDVPGMELGTQHRYAFNILQDFKNEESPSRPEAAELLKKVSFARNPEELCTEIPGIPLGDLLSEPIKIVQSSRVTVILYEAGNAHRQIYSDGRELPKEFSLPAYYGYSVGHCEGDTLVVESAGFNDKAPLDAMGHPHSQGLRLVERYRRRDFGHMDLETTVDVPQMYTRPFTIKVPHELLADSDVFESFCENERDRPHLQKQ